MAILITRIIAKRTRYSQPHKRYWELWSEAHASPVLVFEDELVDAHWLEGEAKKLRDFMLRMSEGQEKTLDVPAVIEAAQDDKYYQVVRVVKGPPVSPEEQDWIDEMASRIRRQVAEIQSAQQARIDALESELADKQRRIDELIATVQTQQARITALGSETDPATAENLPAESPVEAVTEDEEDGAWSAANLFHSVDPALADEDDDDVPVPPRRSEIEVSSTDVFLEQAREYVNRSETAAVPVSYQEYQPTYALMNARQKQWYFYWRTQLRQGNRTTIDLSYLDVHIYEVINMVGFQSPQEAFEYLEGLWRYYRKLHPELNNYLPDWLADFLAVHELPLRPLQWYHKVAKLGVAVDQNLLIEAWLASGGDFESLPNDILFGLANYNPTESRFYQRYAKSLRLDEAYKKGLTAVDEAVRSETGKSLFQTCQSQRSRVIKRPPFRNAIHTYSQTEIKIATVHFWSGRRRLAESLSGIIKCTESIMRERVGYRYKSYRIEPRWKQTIEFALADEDDDDAPVPPRPSVDEIGISASGIRTERLMHPNRAHVVLCYEANMNLIPSPKVLEALSSFIEACQDGQYLNYSQADLPQAQVDRLYLAGMLECSPAASYKLRPSAAGELWHRRHTTSPAEVPQQESVIEPSQAAPPREPVSLRSLLVEAAKSAADANSRPDERATPQEDEDAQRPVDDSDDLLDLSIIATIIGAGESDIKLIEAMMKNGWACTVDDLKDVFEDDKNVFVRVIIDDINDRAQDEMDDNLLEFESGRWEIHEDYRDAIETILAHPDQYRQ